MLSALYTVKRWVRLVFFPWRWYNSSYAPSVPFIFPYIRLSVPWLFAVGLLSEAHIQWTKVDVHLSQYFWVLLSTSKNGIYNQLPNPTMICLPLSVHILFQGLSRVFLKVACQCSCMPIFFFWTISEFWHIVPPMHISYFWYFLFL